MALHCLLARFCFTYVLCVTLSCELQIDEAAAAAASLEAWGAAPPEEGDAALGLLELGAAWSPAATSTPSKGPALEAAPARERAAVKGLLELASPHRASAAWEAAPSPERVAAKGLLRLGDVTPPPSRAWKALERVSVY